MQRYWAIIIFPALYIPYYLLNQYVIVKWLGCGCPVIDDSGNIITNAFNANDFTAIFWSVITLIVVVLSIINIRDINKWYLKAVNILIIAAASIFISVCFFYSMQWK